MFPARMRSVFFTWLDRRVPVSSKQYLNHQKLFIFLNRQGTSFGLLLLLLLLAAINYQNNLIYALLFLLASVLHSAMFFTFANVAGLTIESLGCEPVFAGDLAIFKCRISQQQGRFRGPVYLQLHPEHRQKIYFKEGQTSLTVTLACPSLTRGYLPMPRLLVETSYPLGLLRCWSWLRFDQSCLVYVAPWENSALPWAQTEQGDDLKTTQAKGQEDLSGVRDYVQGDNPKHIHWRAFAKGQGLLVRQFSGLQSATVMLSLSVLPENWPLEKKLAALCYWALLFHEKNTAFGLTLANVEIAIAQGEKHLQQVLTALSLYQEAS